MALVMPVILGSVRSDRKGLRVARYITRHLEERGYGAPLVDPAALQLPLLDRMYKEYPSGQAPEALEHLAGILRSADAFVVVSAEYNHSIPPPLSNTLDHFLDEYFWRPSGIVCYSAGRFGGVRAAMQLRSMLCELGTPSIPSLLPIPEVGTVLDPDGMPQQPWVDSSAKRFLDELVWYAEALRRQRAEGMPYRLNAGPFLPRAKRRILGPCAPMEPGSLRSAGDQQEAVLDLPSGLGSDPGRGPSHAVVLVAVQQVDGAGRDPLYAGPMRLVISTLAVVVAEAHDRRPPHGGQLLGDPVPEPGRWLLTLRMVFLPLPFRRSVTLGDRLRGRQHGLHLGPVGALALQGRQGYVQSLRDLEGEAGTAHA
jgi:NAD(P)H-dependent FMN reductase